MMGGMYLPADEMIEGIIKSILFAPIGLSFSENFESFTETILETLELFALNPIAAYKIADALTFYLSLDEFSFGLISDRILK